MSERPYAAYFPGCTLKTDAYRFETSALAVSKALGLELVELKRWNCCGTVHSLDAANLMPRLASIHNLVRAEEDGHGALVTLCSMCYNTLQRTNLLVGNRQTLAAVNDFLYLERNYSGRVKVYHFLQFVRDYVTEEQIRERVVRPLDGVAVAPYYGCLLLRPASVAIDDPENPQILTPVLSALGARVVDFPLRNECCGAYQTAVHKEAVARRVSQLLESAHSEGAETLAVSCPLCYHNLATFQREACSAHPSIKPLSVVYFTELMARAMGLDYESQAPQTSCRATEAAK